MAKDYLSMASPSPSDAEHHGVKGMKWGVRKAEKAQSQADRMQAYIDRKRGNASKSNIRKQARLQEHANRAFAKADKKWEKSIYTTRGAIDIHNNVASQMNGGVLDKLNNSPKYKDVNLYENPKLMDSYNKEYETLVNKAYAKAVTEIHGQSPSGKKEAVFVSDAQGDRIEVRDVGVTHADMAEPDLVFLLKRDADGLVVEMNEASSELQHDYLGQLKLESNDKLDYGVKGMKWGIRKPSDSAGSTSGGSTTKSIPKAPANETHGQKYDRLRMQVKTHGTNSLSQEELNFVNARTEAIAKINKMNVSSPGWLTDASKVVLQETTKTLMKDLAVKAGKQFIVKPLITGK